MVQIKKKKEKKVKCNMRDFINYMLRPTLLAFLTPFISKFAFITLPYKKYKFSHCHNVNKTDIFTHKKLILWQ